MIYLKTFNRNAKNSKQKWAIFDRSDDESSVISDGDQSGMPNDENSDDEDSDQSQY